MSVCVLEVYETFLVEACHIDRLDILGSIHLNPAS